MHAGKMRRIVPAIGAIICGGWMFAELSLANAQLTVAEMKGVVGGLGGCDFNPEDLTGYHCSPFASMRCDLICSRCSTKILQELCVLDKCWSCATDHQIKECAIGQESEECRTFGGGAENVACGFQQEKACKWNSAEERCYCETPLSATELSCPRKHCANLVP